MSRTDLENTDRRLQTSKTQTSKLRVLYKSYIFDENSLRVAPVFPFLGCLKIDGNIDLENADLENADLVHSFVK